MAFFSTGYASTKGPSLRDLFIDILGRKNGIPQALFVDLARHQPRLGYKNREALSDWFGG